MGLKVGPGGKTWFRAGLGLGGRSNKKSSILQRRGLNLPLKVLTSESIQKNVCSADSVLTVVRWNWNVFQPFPCVDSIRCSSLVCVTLLQRLSSEQHNTPPHRSLRPRQNTELHRSQIYSFWYILE